MREYSPSMPHLEETLVWAGPLPAVQERWAALRGHGIEAWILDQNSWGSTLAVDAKLVVRSVDGAAARELLVELGLQAAGS